MDHDDYVPVILGVRLPELSNTYVTHASALCVALFPLI